MKKHFHLLHDDKYWGGGVWSSARFWIKTKTRPQQADVLGNKALTNPTVHYLPSKQVSHLLVNVMEHSTDKFLRSWRRKKTEPKEEYMLDIQQASRKRLQIFYWCCSVSIECVASGVCRQLHYINLDGSEPVICWKLTSAAPREASLTLNQFPWPSCGHLSTNSGQGHTINFTSSKRFPS